MCGTKVCPACGKILSHIVTRLTQLAQDSFTFWVTCSNTLCHEKNFEHAQNVFCRPACEPHVSWHVAARPRYVHQGLSTCPISFMGVPHLLAHADNLRALGKVIISIIRSGMKLLIHSQTPPCRMFSQRFYDMWVCTVIGNDCYDQQWLYYCNDEWWTFNSSDSLRSCFDIYIYRNNMHVVFSVFKILLYFLSCYEIKKFQVRVPQP